MKKKPVNWQVLILLLFAIAFIGWASLNGHNQLAVLGATLFAWQAMRFVKRDPEIIDAEREVNKTQWRWLWYLAAFVVAGILVAIIDGFEWVRVWILLPVVAAVTIWMLFVLPARHYYRAHQKLAERKKRAAE